VMTVRPNSGPVKPLCYAGERSGVSVGAARSAVMTMTTPMPAAAPAAGDQVHLFNCQFTHIDPHLL
uniref:hypothetical protein n=1 Tax=Klebsiella pneumoniae TaxID=573 RepID=UPI001952CC92